MIVFEFNIVLNDDDYLQFNQYHLLNSRSGKRTLMMHKLNMPIVCLAFIFIFYIAGADRTMVLAEAITLTILSVLWVFLSKKIVIKSMGRRIKKMKKEGRLPYSGEAALKFDENGIQEITPNAEGKTNYSLVEKIAVTDQAIYIYFSSLQAYILPTSVFPNEVERREFLEFIHSKVDALNNRK